MEKLNKKEKEIVMSEVERHMFESNVQYIGDAGKQMISAICSRTKKKQGFVWNSEPHCVIFSSDSNKLIDYMFVLNSKLKTIVVVSVIGSADPAVDIKDANGVNIDGDSAIDGKNKLARRAAKDAVAVLGESADEIMRAFLRKTSEENED